jgi:D-glycero-alpha-D-manno-heptose-7-phosphate kinase
VATARAWCRIDLAGGTLDIWPLGLLHAGAATINFAIDLAVEVRVERSAGRYGVRQDGSWIDAASAAELAARPEAALVGLVAAALGLPPLTATLASASPRGGGLGASSAMTVALIAAAEEAFELPRSSVGRRCRLARDVEAQLMSLPTGIQDHHAAQLGGALEIRHRPGGEEVRRLDVAFGPLAESLLVAYSGQSHFSAGQNWQVVRRRLDGEPGVTGLLAGISDVARALAPALADGDLPRVGALMAEEWALRRQLAPGVSTAGIERLLDLARGLGAWGGKACGAGGGGCIAMLCPPDRKAALAAALTTAGAQVIPTRPAAQPMLVAADPPLSR